MSGYSVHEQRVLQRKVEQKRRMSDVSAEYEESLEREKESSKAVTLACAQLNDACEAMKGLKFA